VATDERRRPGVARVVQGNLYDLQNLDIAEELLAAMTGEGLGGGSALPGQPSTAATVTVQMRS
jgi:hypothetical protein